jgi:hypothetical protein
MPAALFPLRWPGTRRAALAMAALFLAVGGVATPATAASTSAHIASASVVAATKATATTVVAVTPVDSGDLAAGAPLRLIVSLSNETTLATEAATVTVATNSGSITSRDTLADWFTSKSGALAPTVLTTAAFPPVAGGLVSTIEVTIPAARLPWASAGVFPVAVSVIAGSQTLGSAHTAVASNLSSSASIPVAVALPLTVPADGSDFLSASELSQYTAPGGVLTRELIDIQSSQVAVGIDPRILASIRVLGKNAPQSALTWLLEVEALPNETFPLAWADADMTAPLHAGEPAVVQPKALDYAINPSLFPVPAKSSTPTPTPTPVTITQPVIPTSASLVQFNYTLPQLSWPTENSVITSDLPKLTQAGVSAEILSSANVKQADTRGLNGASAVVGTNRIAISDDVLSAYLRTAIQSTTHPSSSSALTQLTTSLALMSLASGADPHPVLLTLGRNWVTSDANFGHSTSEIYAPQWTSAATVSTLFSASPTIVKIDPQEESPTRIALVKTMLASEQAVVSFSPIAKDPEALTSRTRLQLLSALSNEWTTATWPSAGAAFVTAATKTTNSVQVVPSSEAVAFANQTALPVTVSNNLDQDVTVTLQIRSLAALLSVGKSSRSQSVTVEEGSQHRIQIPISALSNGNAEIVATLYSSTGVQIGRTVMIKINVNAGWETTGTLIFAALIVGLFAFGLVRNIRKRRRGVPVE